MGAMMPFLEKENERNRSLDFLVERKRKRGV